jgi:hypothetical protein
VIFELHSGGMLDTSVALSDSDYFRRMKTLITHMPAHMQSHYPAFLSRWINSVAPDLKLHTDVHLGGGRAFFIANSTTDKQGKTEIDFTVVHFHLALIIITSFSKFFFSLRTSDRARFASSQWSLALHRRLPIKVVHFRPRITLLTALIVMRLLGTLSLP